MDFWSQLQVALYLSPWTLVNHSTNVRRRNVFIPASSDHQNLFTDVDRLSEYAQTFIASIQKTIGNAAKSGDGSMHVMKLKVFFLSFFLSFLIMAPNEE